MQRRALIYPSLPGACDVCGIRVGSAGIGNCFYAYFHAVVLAQRTGCRLIAPTWGSIKVGPMLRRELTLRRYGTMFKAHPAEVAGFGKLWRLLCLWPRHTRLVVRGQAPTWDDPRGLAIVEAPPEFTFAGLHAHLPLIRQRLLDILVTPPATAPRWGTGDFVAVHIRMGDFRPVQPTNLSKVTEGMRIPLAWYEQVIRRLRQVVPDWPVHVFSDGHAHELAPVLQIDGVRLRREPSDIADLLAMAQARVLVGSHSTFSRWAVFLGDIPSIWLRSERQGEQPSRPGTPMLAVTEDVHRITEDALTRRVPA